MSPKREAARTKDVAIELQIEHFNNFWRVKKHIAIGFMSKAQDVNGGQTEFLKEGQTRAGQRVGTQSLRHNTRR